VVGRAGQHALQLRLAQARVDRLGLVGRVGDDGLVVLGGAELEVLLGVADVLLELLCELEALGDRLLLLEDLLRGFVVVPEAGAQGRLVQIFELTLEPRDVKDAPLAPQSAFEGRRSDRGSRRAW
jgi:hypothetical protein